MGVECYYDTLELSVLRHYLLPSLTSLKNCVNFFEVEENFSKSDCRKILQSAAAISISSSKKNILSKELLRMVRGHLNVYINVCIYVFVIFSPCDTHLLYGVILPHLW